MKKLTLNLYNMVKKTSFPPRGIRNNNPLNIRRSKTKWNGEVDRIRRQVTDKQGNVSYAEEFDRTFCQFKEMKYGYRAAFKTLRTYIEKHKCDTIEKIINRWAPPCENHTLNYIHTVCMYAAMEKDAPVDFKNKSVMLNIVEGMCVAENGVKYAPSTRMEWEGAMTDGYELALK